MRPIIFLLTIFLSGCSTCQKSGDSAPAQNYVVTEDVFLMRVDGGLHGPRLALVPESSSGRGSGFYASPKSLKKNPSGQWQTNEVVGFNDVIGIVTSGTKIVFVKTKTKRAWSFWYGGITEDAVIFGKITSGPFLEKVVDLSDVLNWPQKRIVPTEEPAH